MKTADTLSLATRAFHKHLAVHGDLNHYTGILSLHGLARLATQTEDKALLTEARKQLLPYVKGEHKFPCNFPNYQCGGNGTAWMFHKGQLPEASETVREYAEEIIIQAPRDQEGILSHPKLPGRNVIWIDVAFAVTPFLLFAGLALNADEYLEEAFQQTAKMVQSFRQKETGLLIQSCNMRGAGHASQDHWSRGNGWGALALAELAVQLPEKHKRKDEAIRLYLDHVKACAPFQDKDGLWHQEMTEIEDSYAETSGTGLMLYALGLGLESGIVDLSERERFEHGLKGLLKYISEDIDIYHTCRGCLCPGQGTKLEYMAKPPVVNDHHAFGPIILAMGQAYSLGIKNI